MKRIKKGDTVIVIAGRSKSHTGKVLQVKENRLIVEGANIVKKHVKPNPQKDEKGGIKSIESFIDISNVALYNPVTSKADRVGFKFIDRDGVSQKVRYFKSNGELVDLV